MQDNDTQTRLYSDVVTFVDQARIDQATVYLSQALEIAQEMGRSLLVSQWSVSDRATKELMIAFYQHYLEHDNKAIALQKAMQEVRSKSDYSHPFYWAAFVVVGAED